MKTVKIRLADITDSYGKGIGDSGAVTFLNKELTKGGFDLSKPFDRHVDRNEQSLVCEQE